ncbi:hypothetical protein FZEAL_2712 [Fusarium zealandicum]|uniref:Ketoreductase domain-containing protein n=1 Tax=Fusarium zealandicum TaxID=1053134 RepID=A0A8H4XMH4_9HYPO|nr:hypothetical protein FZEAL_2712 [Fusarium zealandicum]
MASYFVSGASRGLGLGICTALAAKPASEVSIIYAAVRTETEAIKELASSASGRVELVQLDVSSQESIKQAAGHVEASLGDKGLDVLLNVAGVTAYTPEGIHTMDDLGSLFTTNVVGVHNVTRAFLPLLRKGNLKKVINFSSTIGSVAWASQYKQAPHPAYKVSKTALNMLTVQYAHSFEDEGFTIIALSPGWVKTELGGPYGLLDVETSVEATLDIVFRVKKEDNGKFLNVRVPGYEDSPTLDRYLGEEVPW